ncbi:MAG: glycosyltransferase family 2 protein [Alphaproteobacteria bacterium]|nr:glycosyltransferase family 2 protein [Alphaproteobacteria bacterium]MBP7729365.1 glycosyltransferase family 2 protein [Alphaproteobacteria bacterium]
MYKNKKIAAIVPAFNEEEQIIKVIASMHPCVDSIVIVNDDSTDKTVAVIESKMSNHPNIILLHHDSNQGVGGAIATGYKWARDHKYDAVAVLAGDNQMDPKDLPALLDPIVNDEVDYTKANRLIYAGSKQLIPQKRFWGNAVLSLLTKIASGYWHISDSQTGYTVINLKALQVIDWDTMYKRYGQPNDLLVRLNIHNFRVRDIPLKPVYNIGEKSKLKIRKVIFPISFLLIKLFFWRIREKYIIRDFHPLVLFYAYGFFSLFVGIFMMLRFLTLWIVQGKAPEITLILSLFCLGSGIQSTFFAMWFDQDTNKNLR